MKCWWTVLSTCGGEFLVVPSEADPGDAGGAVLERLGIHLEEHEQVAGEEDPDQHRQTDENRVEGLKVWDLRRLLVCAEGVDPHPAPLQGQKSSF